MEMQHPDGWPPWYLISLVHHEHAECVFREIVADSLLKHLSGAVINGHVVPGSIGVVLADGSDVARLGGAVLKVDHAPVTFQNLENVGSPHSSRSLPGQLVIIITNIKDQ